MGHRNSGRCWLTPEELTIERNVLGRLPSHVDVTTGWNQVVGFKFNGTTNDLRDFWGIYLVV
jgi:hypothetical protein